MAKRHASFRLEPEVLRLVRELSEHLREKLGTQVSQAAVIEIAVKRMAKEEKA